MNSFDAVVYGLGVVAIVTGFSAGLLRSMATISGYVAAMPVAVATTSVLAPVLNGTSNASWAENSLLFSCVFLVMGITLGGLLRTAVSVTVGPSVSMVDRL